MLRNITARHLSGESGNFMPFSFLVAGLLGPLHGLFELLPVVHGTAHRAISKPSELQQYSEPGTAVAFTEKHDALY